MTSRRPEQLAPGPRLASVHRLPLAGADDAALARAAASGAPGAPEAVWDRFSPMVRRVLRRSMGPGAEVEDLVQEVFLSFFRQVRELRDPAAVESFFFGIAIRVARAEIRKRRVRRWLRLTDDGALPEEIEAPAEDAEAREAIARLYAILDQSDAEGRLAFVLRHIEGLELPDVAEALGVSLATAKRRLARVSARILAAAAKDPVLRAYVQARPAATADEGGPGGRR
ncbi:MAG: sigma-70 family RNA polymerase sigma factor [Minicystis sp.]